MNPILLSVLVAVLNWDALIPAQRAYSTFTVKQGIVHIATSSPTNHLAGLKMTTGDKGIKGFYLDKGIYTSWRFNGSKGSDFLTFGSQGVIISKRDGGIVDFKNDNARDVFTFTNRIDVAKCSEKHGIQCHPLNHLQQVTIKNFGREDEIIIQGRKYGYKDVRNGTLLGVPASRLRIELSKPKSRIKRVNNFIHTELS
jgi:hypothetical protein